ncbi:hypothetical protein Q5752_006751 [Cryptotrichosporon argae]
MSDSSTAAAYEAAAQIALSGNKGLSFGPFLIGMLIDSILCGVVVHQFIRWYTFAHEDRLFIRGIVFLVLVESIILSGYSCAYICHLFVFNFGRYSQFEQTDWLGWFPLIDVCIIAPVQAFYADRAWRLNKQNPFVLGVTALLIVVGFAGGLGTKIAFSLLTSATQVSGIKTFVYLWLAGTLAADVAITSAVLHGLYRSRTGWGHTDKLITRLLAVTLESQLLPALIAAAFLIEYRIQADSFIGAFFELIQSKIYVVGLLAVLNSRFGLRADLSGGREDGKTDVLFAGDAGRHVPAVHVESYAFDSPSPRTPSGRAGDDKMADDIELSDYDTGSNRTLTRKRSIDIDL